MNIQQTIQKLTLEEKAALLQGWSTWTSREVKHLGIPPMFMSDGPVGLRKQAGAGDHLGLNASVPATCFPVAAAMANTWDTELGEALGTALGAEAAANDVHVVLGPGLNIKRSPLCGRNFEYFSEDPYLAGKMAASYIRGIQSNGVAACPKHYAVNSQELRRMAMDSVLDERTLREIYLTGFEIAVKEGNAKSIMSAYNMVNGVYANENAHLLDEILRNPDVVFEPVVKTRYGFVWKDGSSLAGEERLHRREERVCRCAGHERVAARPRMRARLDERGELQRRREDRQLRRRGVGSDGRQARRREDEAHLL